MPWLFGFSQALPSSTFTKTSFEHSAWGGNVCSQLYLQRGEPVRYAYGKIVV